jgi:Tfp pilus assembly protein PilF
MQPTSRIFLLLPLALAACSDSSEPAGGDASTSSAQANAQKHRVQREEAAEVRELRRHIDLGRTDEALPLLGIWGARLGIEAELLEARLHTLVGNDTEAVRAIERARAIDTQDPRVSATMIEISSAVGHLETARAELDRAISTLGSSAELLRAQGVMELYSAGGARRGVSRIESALRLDPDLPFVERALAQGYLLLAKEALAAGRPTAALEAAQHSLSYDPQEIETRRVLADILASGSRLEEAILVITELVDEGEPLQGELASLHKKAGIATLIPVPGETDDDRETRRSRALEHLVTAREYGLTDEELASGTRILVDEADRLAERGSRAYREDDLDLARDSFERALRYDPDHLSARNHYAVVLYRLEDYAEAARQWREVMVVMEGEGIVPPEPIHLNLAQAQVQDGDRDGARGTLERWLERNESNADYADYIERTREVLAQL